MKSIDEQIKIIMKGAAEIISKEDLRSKLQMSQNTGKPLIVKLGLDPTAPDIHLGHAVVLRKIKQLQDLGHKAVIIIGDFTGMIGDPTGRSKTRKQLTQDEVVINAKTYESQIFKILDKEKTELRFNSEWLRKLNFNDIIHLASKCTVARILERDDFQKRFREHESIGVHELFYPLMQGYDSVELKADIELGGTDQKFNILLGRNLQKDYEQQSQVAIFMPILEGTDGIEKMSKSLGNYIGINESANDMYVKVMSLPDNLIIRYYELATDIHPDDLAEIKNYLEDINVNPRDIKMNLAREITKLYHGVEASVLAENYFKQVFQKGKIPDDVIEFNASHCLLSNNEIDLAKLLVSANFCRSNSEGRRLILQGGVKINGIKTDSLTITGLSDGDIVQSGKQNFVKIKFKG